MGDRGHNRFKNSGFIPTLGLSFHKPYLLIAMDFPRICKLDQLPKLNRAGYRTHQLKPAGQNLLA